MFVFAQKMQLLIMWLVVVGSVVQEDHSTQENQVCLMQLGGMLHFYDIYGCNDDNQDNKLDTVLATVIVATTEEGPVGCISLE